MVGQVSQRNRRDLAAHFMAEGGVMVTFLIIAGLFILIMEGGPEAPQKQEAKDATE